MYKDIRHNVSKGQLVTSRMAGEFQPAFKDIMHGAKYVNVDPLSCVACSRIQNISQRGVMRFVSVFSGAGGRTLEPAACGIAYGSNSAIVVPLHKTDVHVVNQTFC